MSRVSDTRLRTREAAAQLVSTGRRSHDLTVDLIYAEIKQGSRTTINDELKLWKDEQAKADALTAALPPAVASAMLNMWALAVEHGEKAFDLRLEEVETHLAKATTSVESLGAEKSGLLQKTKACKQRSPGANPSSPRCGNCLPLSVWPRRTPLPESMRWSNNSNRSKPTLRKPFRS